MKGAKDLDELMTVALNPWDMTVNDSNAIVAELRRLAAIDSAVTGEVGEIAKRQAEWAAHFDLGDEVPQVRKDLAALLAIAQRQAAVIAENNYICERCEDEEQQGDTMNELRDKREALQQEKTEANATILRLRAEANEQREFAELAIATSERRTQELMVAEEHLRLIDKHAAPVVDMTKGGVLRVPVLPINEQDEIDLADIMADHYQKKNRTLL